MGKQEETRIQRPVAQTGGESGGARGASGTHGLRQSTQAGMMAVLLPENPGSCLPDPPDSWMEAPE